MKLSTIILAVLSAAGQVLAFTNGTLVPAYICNPTPDGLPKSFGQLLQYVEKNLRVVGFDSNVGDNDNNVPRVNTTTTSTTVPNSAYVLASFHNSPNQVTPIPQGINVSTASRGPLIAGQANQLVLQSQIAGVELVGVLIYGNNAAGQRTGNFTDQGGKFIPFAGCGLNQQGQISGVIQTMSVAKNGTYTQLWYNILAGTTGNITLAGLSVTNSGFGVWSYNFSVATKAGGTVANVTAQKTNGTTVASPTPLMASSVARGGAVASAGSPSMLSVIAVSILTMLTITMAVAPC